MLLRRKPPSCKGDGCVIIVHDVRIIVEKHPDDYVAHPLGSKGGVDRGDTHDEILADLKSVKRVHIENVGTDAFDLESPVLEAFVAETRLAIPDATVAPATVPNHPRIKGTTLRAICTQADISREDFPHAYQQE